MEVMIRPYKEKDIKEMAEIWNAVVEDGIAFPQTDTLKKDDAAAFFLSQTYCGAAELAGSIVGLYILHPNNVGRCAHIANSSYAVRKDIRGHKIGEMLVRDSIRVAAAHGFHILQFNAVVATNSQAIHLYNKIGFTQLGRIPGGFLLSNNRYEDIIIFYIELLKNK